MTKQTSFETVADLVPWLEGRGVAELRGWLLEALEEDSRLRQKLCRQARRESGQAPDLKALREQMVRATAPPRRGFVDWRGAGDYCDAMERACVDPLEDLLNEGHATEVIELSEEVFRMTERASEFVQDEGEIGMICDRLKVLHLEACRLAAPDGVALAQRLFHHLISSGADHFPDVIKNYQLYFGPAGLTAFKRLAEDRLAGLPVPPPEPMVDSNAFPAKKSLAKMKLRERQQRAAQELTYRRREAQALLDQCTVQVQVEHGRPAGAGQRSS
jgi:hypothetical protein